MAGRPGRNRAWNKLPVEVHLMRGTYRADRHGPQAAGLHRVDDTEPAAGPLPPELVEGLPPGSLGAAFLDECWGNFVGWSPATLIALRETAMLINAVEASRGTKDELAKQKLLLAALRTLRLP